MTHLDDYITTTIPYVNGRPHIGHALEFVQADALTRALKKQGRNVFFQTGTDDNAVKNVRSAKEAGITPKDFVDQNADKFLRLCRAYLIDYDTFVRTSSEEHQQGVQEFWQNLNSEDLYKKEYQGLYCYGCEDFLKIDELIDGKCPDHLKPPELIKEENIFFRLSRYQAELFRLIEADQIEIHPRTRKTEVLSFIQRGLTDISVSRDHKRTEGWGVPIPGEPEQVVYVWIDALLNYLTGQGYGKNDDWKNVWNKDVNKVHCIGKNVWKFHAIYWPALLLSAGLPLPNKIFIHGFLTESGQKISKSLGGGVDPFELASRYGADSVRFYLLNDFSPFRDGDFSIDGLLKSHNTYLANGLGNFFSRLKKLRGTAGSFDSNHSETPCTEAQQKSTLGETFRFDELSQEVFRELSYLNAEINSAEPWKVIKQGRPTDCIEQLKLWSKAFESIGNRISPIIPQGGESIGQFSTLCEQTTEKIHIYQKW